jgi:hypothetical protein
LILQIAIVFKYCAAPVIVPNNTVHLQTNFKPVHAPEEKQHDSSRDFSLHSDALRYTTISPVLAMTRLLSLAAPGIEFLGSRQLQEPLY